MEITYMLVIDFEDSARVNDDELVAYCTGQTAEPEEDDEDGENVYGAEEAKQFDEYLKQEGWSKNPFETIVSGRVDDFDERWWPSTLYNSPNAKDTSPAIIMNERPTPVHVEIVKSRAYEYAAQKGHKITGFRLIIETTITTVEEQTL